MRIAAHVPTQPKGRKGRDPGCPTRLESTPHPNRGRSTRCDDFRTEIPRSLMSFRVIHSQTTPETHQNAPFGAIFDRKFCEEERAQARAKRALARAHLSVLCRNIYGLKLPWARDRTTDLSAARAARARSALRTSRDRFTKFFRWEICYQAQIHCLDLIDVVTMFF